MAVLINVLATVAGLAIKKTASTYALAAPALHETVIDQRGAVGDLRANSSVTGSCPIVVTTPGEPWVWLSE